MRPCPIPHTPYSSPRAPRSSRFRLGQSIAEVLVAVAVGVILIGAAASLILPSLRGNTQATNVEEGSTLARGMLDNVRVFSESNWDSLLALATGSTNIYFLQTGKSPFVVATGIESVPYDGITSGLVGWWKLDEGFGSSTTDSSGGGDTGTWNGSSGGTGATHYAAGKIGQYSGNFDGSTNYVDLGYPAQLEPNNLTVSAWEKTAVGSSAMVIVRSRLNGYSLSMNASGHLSFNVWSNASQNPTVTSAGTYADNAWHHVVGVYNGLIVSLYIDGSLVGTAANAGPSAIYYAGGGVAIGRDGNFSGSYWSGNIDDVRIYNRALSSGEVTQIYNDAYRRYFYLNDVYRASSGTITTSGGSYDPSTKQIVVGYSWPGEATQTVSTYLTRNENIILDQTDWSGGAGQSGPVTTTNDQFATSSNIDYSTTTGSFVIAFSPNFGSGGSGGSSTTFSGYSYERAITVTSNTSLASGTLSSFPMLVSSTLSTWEPTSTGGHVSNLCSSPTGVQEPCDLSFSATSSCATSLSFETESYVSSTGALVDWVSVPTLSAGTVVYACYGNPSVSTDQSRPSSTWDSHYAIVSHFDESGTPALDSTANGTNSAALNNYYNYPTQASGMIGSGQLFTAASSQMIYWSSVSALSGATSAVLSGWLKRTTTSSYDDLSNEYAIGLSGQATTDYPGAGGGYNSFSAPNDTNWHYYVVSYDGTQSGSARIATYLDGNLVSVSAGPTAASSLTATSLHFGNDWNGSGQYGNQTADEFRLTVGALRSPSWILTEYSNQSSPSTFYSMGSEQTSGGGGSAVLSVSPSGPLSYTGNVGGASSTQNVTILNNASSGASSLNWSASSTASWLTFSTSSGSLSAGSSTSLGIIASPTGLSLGTYNATATIQAASSSNSPMNMAVVLTVTSTPPVATNISGNASQHWAWNDSVGWINFYATNNIVVSSHSLTGYGSSTVGDVSLDCHTTRIGNICAKSNYQVLNDGSGNLSGWAWNDAIGWISFNCSNNGGCGTSNYRTYIDSTGNFQGYAWNDVVGWIDFNCDNIIGACITSNYEVSTSWVATSSIGSIDSTTFDTGSTAGATINSVIWQGSLPAATAIGFQFAVSSSSAGPWNFVGPDGTGSSTFSGSPGASISLGYSQFSGFRYFRYRIILTSDITQTYTPRVDEVSVNWSP